SSSLSLLRCRDLVRCPPSINASPPSSPPTVFPPSPPSHRRRCSHVAPQRNRKHQGAFVQSFRTKQLCK
ncbi:hypothetical protein LINPERHAP1_LOCUS431, partial [Linum perenne]